MIVTAVGAEETQPSPRQTERIRDLPFPTQRKSSWSYHPHLVYTSQPAYTYVVKCCDHVNVAVSRNPSSS